MILEVKNITKNFSIERGFFKQEKAVVKALRNVSFKVDEFKTTGIVGESGSGKTTLAKIILRLILPTSGEILFNQEQIADFRKDVQIVFQNPYSSLNPKMRVIDLLTEPLLIHRIIPKKLFRERAVELLEMVDLDDIALNRLPIEFSGGQRQRICIARALASQPKLLVLDEPISSLDLTIQSLMLDLFLKLKEKFNLTYIFITHNLAVVKYVADSVIVMQDGEVLEMGEADQIFKRPENPYTKVLIEAARR